jgi:hypothetical protein
MNKLQLDADIQPLSEFRSKTVDKIEVLEDIKIAEEQINSGLGITHESVKKKFLKGIKK